MRITSDRHNEIITIFQASFKRDNSDELNAISLQELKKADEMTGHRDVNVGWRKAIRNRIEELTAEENRKRDKKIR